MTLPESFLASLGDPQITPDTGRLVDIPKPLLKHLKPLGHELTLWQTAARNWLTKLGKERFEPGLMPFLQHWKPPTEPKDGKGNFFSTVLSETAQGWKIIASSLVWVNDPAWSALLHLPALQSFWTAEVRGSHLEHLRQTVSRAWFMDTAPLPPGSVIAGLDIPSWPNLNRLKGQARQWVIHDTPARLNDSLPDEDWAAAITQAMENGSRLLVEQPQGGSMILARYKKSAEGIHLDGVWQTV